MIIGVTGLMGSGKSTLCENIIKQDKSIKFINVDVVRGKLMKSNDFLEKISKSLEINITNRTSLNQQIYSNDLYMKKYKDILYSYLFNIISLYKNEDIVLVEWALIIKDNLIKKFDKLIIIDKSMDFIMNNVSFPDLTPIQIKERLMIQQNQFIDFSNIKIPYIIHKNIDTTIKFIKEK